MTYTVTGYILSSKYDIYSNWLHYIKYTCQIHLLVTLYQVHMTDTVTGSLYQVHMPDTLTGYIISSKFDSYTYWLQYFKLVWQLHTLIAISLSATNCLHKVK